VNGGERYGRRKPLPVLQPQELEWVLLALEEDGQRGQRGFRVQAFRLQKRALFDRETEEGPLTLEKKSRGDKGERQMALQCVCDKGHTYVQADVYYDWPEGAPSCPRCFAEWQNTQESKDSIRRMKDALGIQVYADEYGIGIFEESDDYETQHFCSDLRLDDAETFLRFMREITVAGIDKGWLPADLAPE